MVSLGEIADGRLAATIGPARLPFTNCYINATRTYGRDLIVELNRMAHPTYLYKQEVWNWTRKNALRFAVDTTDPYAVLQLYLGHLFLHSLASVSTLYMNGKRFNDSVEPLQLLIRNMPGLTNIVVDGNARVFVWAIEKELDAALVPANRDSEAEPEDSVRGRPVLPCLQRLEIHKEDWQSRYNGEKVRRQMQYQADWSKDPFVHQLIRTFEKWCMVSGREKLPLIVIIEPAWLSREHVEKLFSSGVVGAVDSPQEDNKYMKSINIHLW